MVEVKGNKEHTPRTPLTPFLNAGNLRCRPPPPILPAHTHTYSRLARRASRSPLDQSAVIQALLRVASHRYIMLFTESLLRNLCMHLY